MSCPAKDGDEFSVAEVTRVTGACSSWGKQRITLAFLEITLPAYRLRNFHMSRIDRHRSPVLLTGRILATGPGLPVFHGRRRSSSWGLAAPPMSHRVVQAVRNTPSNPLTHLQIPPSPQSRSGSKPLKLQLPPPTGSSDDWATG